MNNNLIQIEKGKYTALLRRVLGMQVSENGTTETEAIFSAITSAARRGSYGGTHHEIDSHFETIGFALEYYNLRKEEWSSIPPITENEIEELVERAMGETGKINLRKNVDEDDCDCDDCV
jgi:hypothetical protein